MGSNGVTAVTKFLQFLMISDLYLELRYFLSQIVVTVTEVTFKFPSWTGTNFFFQSNFPIPDMNTSKPSPFKAGSSFLLWMGSAINRYGRHSIQQLHRISWDKSSFHTLLSSFHTGWSIRLYTIFCWHQIESCILVWGGYSTVTDLLFGCHQKAVYTDRRPVIC